MTESKYIYLEPRPWKASNSNALGEWLVYDKFNKKVGSENAVKLFAAAPELLAACHSSCELCKFMHRKASMEMCKDCKIGKAIQAAEGEG